MRCIPAILLQLVHGQPTCQTAWRQVLQGARSSMLHQGTASALCPTFAHIHTHINLTLSNIDCPAANVLSRRCLTGM